MKWTKAETKLVEKFFKNTTTVLTLFYQIHKINPARTFEAVARTVRRWKSEGYIKQREEAQHKLRIGYFDIETTNLNANFGFMLSWYIKKANKNEYDFAIITKKEIFDYQFDKRLMLELFDALEHYDILYTHYGGLKRFDIPYIITRAYAHGLEKRLSMLKEKFIRDTWPIARTRLRLHSNRLDSIAEAVRVKGVKKTPLKPEIWRLASVGHPESLKYIAIHNKHDVQILEKIAKKLEPVERKQFITV